MNAHTLLPLILLLFCQTLPALELSASLERSTTGTFSLSWEDAEGVRYELIEEGGQRDPRIVYRGTDTARVMTGMPNGSYSYRVRALLSGGSSPWSQPVGVTVAHHPLTRALGFFAVGLLVFLATLVLILRGERNG
jgi:hypothetical protein